MSEQTTTANCKRCNHQLFGDFCSNCGHPQKLKRINGKYVFSEIVSVLNFDKGILFTIKELLIRPGLNIQKFILEDRNRLVKPILFLIVCSLFYSVFQEIFHFEEDYQQHVFDSSSTTVMIMTWISANYGYANVLMAIFIALWTKIFFRKHNYGFFEILILLCFVIGIGMLIFSIFGMFQSLTATKVLNIGFFIGMVYISWAIGQFFEKKFLNYIKALLAYLLGFISFSIAIVLIGTLIDTFL